MKPILIGLSGVSGAGKSTLVDFLESQGGVRRFRFDAYYKNTEECPKASNGKPHWDLPESLHLDQAFEDLRELKEGNEIQMPVYDRRTCARTSSVWFEPFPIVFAEGMYLFFDSRIRDVFDLRLWLDVSFEVALARRLARQPDYDLNYYHTVALPTQKKFVLPLKIFSHVNINGERSEREIVLETDRVVQKYVLG